MASCLNALAVWNCSSAIFGVTIRKCCQAFVLFFAILVPFFENCSEQITKKSRQRLSEPKTNRSDLFKEYWFWLYSFEQYLLKHLLFKHCFFEPFLFGHYLFEHSLFEQHRKDYK